ncbi:MAG: cell division ATP-binding protein FtsE [Tissierellia bacterium]|nr:cell division ATP-binding protein FtsE [Tissierellia bacterium]
MIRFENVYKEYPNGTLALQNINLNIEKGEFVFLVGASGAGKSTMIKVLLSEEKITRGNLYFNDDNVTKIRNARIPFYRRQIGTVFQDFRLLPTMTVYENVAYAMEIVGASNKDIRRRVPIVLGIVNLSKKANCYPTELSGGESQRVAIARAIVNNPELLIADEPTGNLDYETAIDVMNALIDINKRGTTIIMATHAKSIVDEMQKRVLQLENGKLIRDEVDGYYDKTVETDQVDN